MGIFDWDDGNRGHIALHGVTPAEAEQVYLNDPVDEGVDNVEGEERFIYLGETNRGRILRLLITMRGELVRVVTCFEPSRAAKLSYMHSKR